MSRKDRQGRSPQRGRPPQELSSSGGSVSVPGRHLCPERLQQLAEGRLSPRLVEELAPHLVGCPECSEHLSELTEQADRLIQALAADLAIFAQKGDSALGAELRQRSPESRRRTAESDPRLATWGGIELLLRLSREEWGGDPRAAEDWAVLALEILPKLPAELYGRVFLADLRVRVWCFIGNALRIRGDHRGAAAAFDKAEAFLDRGCRDPVERAELLTMRSILLRARCHFEPALRLLDQVIAIYRWAGDRHRLCRALIVKSITLRVACRPRESLAPLHEARSLVDAETEPLLLLSIQHNLGISINEAGDPREAARLLPEVRRLARIVGGHLDQLRGDWLAGLVADNLGEMARAETMLRRARDGFIEEGLGFDAALVSLDLAASYLRAGRTTETQQLAHEMLPVFHSLDIHREALAALAIFRQATELETVTIGMVRDIATYLRQTGSLPPLRFEQPS